MHRTARAALNLAFCLGLAAATPAVGIAATTAPTIERGVETTRVVASATRQVAAATSPAPCADRAFNFTGGRWNKTYRWSFRAGSTPSGLGKPAAEAVIKRGINNIVRGRNDCGRADRIRATASYQGRTTRRANCARMDGFNVVAFRALPSDVAARTCWWVSGGRIVEADIQINSNLAWATSLAACRGQLMLEAVMTHEAGHAFGMGHVGEKRHGRLTMSPYIDGLCNNQESTLGLGDMLGLERLYP